MNGWFATGTDTGVGKTLVSTAIVAALSRRGRRVAVMKPCETGVSDPSNLGDDAIALLRASGLSLDSDDVSPFRYRLPAAPEIAARAEGRTINVAEIRARAERLAARADAILVEGAGGVLVPLTPDHDAIDLAVLLGLPAIVVARAALGTINHTRLTVEALRARHVSIAGIVLSSTAAATGPEEAHTRDAIVRLTGETVLGALPHLPDADRQSLDALASAAARHLDLDALERQIQPRAR